MCWLRVVEMRPPRGLDKVDREESETIREFLVQEKKYRKPRAET